MNGAQRLAIVVMLAVCAAVPLFAPQFEVAATLGYLACWLVVAQAVLTLASRQGGVEALLGLIAAALVGRLLLAGQVFVPSELLALLLLLPALAYWLDLGSVAQTRATRPQPRTTPA